MPQTTETRPKGAGSGDWLLGSEQFPGNAPARKYQARIFDPRALALPKRSRGRPTAAQNSRFDLDLAAWCAAILEINSTLDFRVSSRGRWPDGKPYEADRPFGPAAIAVAPSWLLKGAAARRKAERKPRERVPAPAQLSSRSQRLSRPSSPTQG